MPLALDYESNAITVKSENVMSLWSLLKELVDTPYLKSYVIENYEGGNTLVPRSAWEDDGVLYREVAEDIFLFPYESIGFIFDDTINNVNIYVIDNYSAGMNYKNDFMVSFSIRNVDRFTMKMRDRSKISYILAYYLLSYMKMNFDTGFVYTIELLLRSSISYKNQTIELLPPTVSLGLSEMQFVLKITDDNEKIQFSQYFCGKKCKRKIVNEREITSLGYIKKKLFSKIVLLKYLYYAFLVAIPVGLYILLEKILKIGKMRVFIIFGFLFLFIAGKFIYSLYKRKNIYKHYSKKIQLEQFKEES
ncbi:MAG: hypothetical protein A2014_06680 [Spirochaetes bacterium GWF1_49_6]|nr:MAG: hypothetical protein A2014_06680 [Spirochaetes bacterium GWF1_49_6]